MAKLLNLYVQGHDVQEGVSIPLRHLDYPAIQNWLSWIAQIDPKGSYPFFIASHFYTQQPDPKRIRLMTEFVASRYAQNPAHRWPFLAHAVYIARAQLKDDALAKLYAIQLREQAQAFGVLGLIPPWAAQMELFLQTDISHQQAHRALIGGLVHSGQIQDPHTWTFLKQKLEQDQTQDNNQYKRSHTDIP
jgi:hypothetical protein